MTPNEELCEKALKVVNELFSDDSVSQSETYEALDALCEEIEVMMDTLDTNE